MSEDREETIFHTENIEWEILFLFLFYFKPKIVTSIYVLNGISNIYNTG